MRKKHGLAAARPHPDRIVILSPFAGAERSTDVWADDEARIDFRRDAEQAARCTVSFAAVELKTHLAKIVDAEISFAAAAAYRGTDVIISLSVTEPSGKDESFTLEPVENGVLIRGAGRTGVLYGVYEFLRMQGWRWLAPGSEGEIAPPRVERLQFPSRRLAFRPSFSLGRGFVFECASLDSVALFLWMARNRMNVSGHRPLTGAFCAKLGMSPAIGGHIFEPILNPDRVLLSGKTIWDEHPEWYGLPADGKRRKETAQRTQFCVSQAGLMDFLGGELLGYLNGKWKDAERIDVWGFDTWGAACTCDCCRRLGNNSDQALHCASQLRDRIDQARRRGALDHDVRLSLCAYEGTGTISGPSAPVPRNLLDAGDYITFYPINRCYAHDFSDPACSWNAAYCQSLQSWSAIQPALPIMSGEYYNVSKFEDLPLLFTSRIAADLPAYHRLGCRGLTYMHVPLVNWAMRTLTQWLYAQLAWDAGADVNALLDEYFHLWYGPHAERMRNAYGLIERGWQGVSQWRAWSGKSILSQLLAWDGATAEQPFAGNDHITSGRVVVAGRRSCALLKKALALTMEAISAEQQRLSAEAPPADSAGVNPQQLRELELRRSQYEKRLGEDRRLLLYGIDTLAAMTEMVAYHDALFHRDLTAGERAWQKLERLADRLDSYFLPITHDYPGPGLISKDALTRSQLREGLRRCRKQRLTSAGARPA